MTTTASVITKEDKQQQRQQQQQQESSDVDDSPTGFLLRNVPDRIFRLLLLLLILVLLQAPVWFGDGRPRRTSWLLRDNVKAVKIVQPERRGNGTTSTVPDVDDGRPNLLFIVSDQLRYDCLRFVQDRMPMYAGKLKINTPNLDRLASQGISFETAYCVSPSCAPARATLRTGNCLQRAAIKVNKMVEETVYKRMRSIEEAVDELETFEQIMVEELDYRAETYGKWHVPRSLFYSRTPQATGTVTSSTDGLTSRRRIIQYNDYSFEQDSPRFEEMQNYKPFYQRQVKYLTKRDGVDTSFRDGEQTNTFSQFPYQPIQLDSRYGYPTNTDLRDKSQFEKWQRGNMNVCGRDSLDVNHTSTAVLGKVALRALDRLASQSKPWSLSVHFNAPHPPRVATSYFLNKYWNDRGNLLISPSIDDTMNSSAYRLENGRNRIGKSKYGYNDPVQMAEMTAVYYAMIEEVDDWVGRLVEAVEQKGSQTAENTIIVFTADHGELLGSHGMVGKGVLLEEATRVPLIMKYGSKIAGGRIIKEPVSHMDIFSTLLDYTGGKAYDKSDGSSLRRYIDRTYYNQDFDDRVVVAEMDRRVPISNLTFTRDLGSEPNLMIRRGQYKMLLPKKSDSAVTDMLYDLKADPFEMSNLLRNGGEGMSNALIGKTEHLKILLLEWMRRMDGSKGYYSDKNFNAGVGNGDIAEIRGRRTWPAVPFWFGDTELSFGTPALQDDGTYLRNEYLYMGRTTDGTLIVSDISVTGLNATYFDVGETRQATISRNGYLRLQVAFRSDTKIEDMSALDAAIEFDLDGHGLQTIKIVGEPDE